MFGRQIKVSDFLEEVRKQLLEFECRTTQLIFCLNFPIRLFFLSLKGGKVDCLCLSFVGNGGLCLYLVVGNTSSFYTFRLLNAETTFPWGEEVRRMVLTWIRDSILWVHAWLPSILGSKSVIAFQIGLWELHRCLVYIFPGLKGERGKQVCNLW